MYLFLYVLLIFLLGYDWYLRGMQWSNLFHIKGMQPFCHSVGNGCSFFLETNKTLSQWATSLELVVSVLKKLGNLHLYTPWCKSFLSWKTLTIVQHRILYSAWQWGTTTLIQKIKGSGEYDPIFWKNRIDW